MTATPPPAPPLLLLPVLPPLSEPSVREPSPTSLPKLSRRFEVVFALSIISACIGVVGGLWLSIETDAQTGPCIVLLLCVLFALAVLRARLTSPAAASPALPAKANP